MTHVFLAALLGPIYLIIGLSFLVYAGTWMNLVKDFSKNHFHLLPIALGELIFAMVILLTHNVWEWSPWLIVTLTGWAMLLESAFYLLAPGEMIKNCFKWMGKEKFFQGSGVVFLLLGLYLSWVVFL